MPTPENHILKAEILGLWYFRLTGVFTMSNFVLHPDRRGSARTDADIAGVRFPNRHEFPPGDGGDDEWFQKQDTKPCAIIAEVKTSQCAINGPWSDPARENVNKILSDLGLYSTDELVDAAKGLYETGMYDGSGLFCSLFCVGNATSPDVAEKYPAVPQRTWSEIARWIYRRFFHYEDTKSDHDQWDDVGKAIWSIYRAGSDAGEFEHGLRQRFGLPPAQSPRY